LRWCFANALITRTLVPLTYAPGIGEKAAVSRFFRGYARCSQALNGNPRTYPDVARDAFAHRAGVGRGHIAALASSATSELPPAKLLETWPVMDW
jgi:hypothetical protein